MYQGIKTDRYLGTKLGQRHACFLYNVCFVIRRAIIVICLVLFYKSHQQQLLYILIAVQSAYILYIIEVMPHIEQGYNILEVINEIVTTFILYTLKGYLGTTFL